MHYIIMLEWWPLHIIRICWRPSNLPKWTLIYCKNDGIHTISREPTLWRRNQSFTVSLGKLKKKMEERKLTCMSGMHVRRTRYSLSKSQSSVWGIQRFILNRVCNAYVCHTILNGMTIATLPANVRILERKRKKHKLPS